jgi:mono/diheme cytochrome c family protein
VREGEVPRFAIPHPKARVAVGLLTVSLLTSCARDSGDTTEPIDPAASYERYCAVCHGLAGEGLASTGAPSLNNPDFLAAADDAFLYANIARGRPGTTMTVYEEDLGGPLSAAEIEAIVAHLRTWGAYTPPLEVTAPAGTADPARDATPASGPGARPDATRLGAAVYMRDCAECHGPDGRSPTAPDLANPTFLETASEDYIRRAIVTGRRGTEMPAFPELTLAELDAVTAYVMALGG